MDPEIDAIVLCAGSKGGENEVGGLVLAVNIHLAGFDLGTHTVDVRLCGFCAAVLDAGRKILQMMAQVVAVGAGLALALPHGFDLTHGLSHLQVQAVPGLFQLAAQLLLLCGVQHKAQIGQTAHKGHELHSRLIAAGKQIGVDAGKVVKEIAQQRDHAELQLQQKRGAGQRPHRRCDPADQHQKDRQGDDQLGGVLQRGAARRKQRNDQQRGPAPQLAAQIGCQHGYQRP